MLLKSAFTILVVFQSAQALNPSAPTSTRNSMDSVKKSSDSHRSRWSVVVPSFVIHGLRPSSEASEEMPRKIDENGDGVLTPGLGFKYEGSRGELLVGGLVKDCYDNLAGTLQYGFYSPLSRNSKWGLTFGLYVRETPVACETMDFAGSQVTECHQMDRYDFKFQTQVNGVPVDLIPMPFLHFSTALYRSRDLEINFKVMSNFVLNEFGVAVPF